jgi:outer membrane receptor protein involved in Fe transport
MLMLDAKLARGRQFMNSRFVLMVSSAVVALAMPATAHAASTALQEADDPGTPSSESPASEAPEAPPGSEPVASGDIVVTAQRRSELLIDVPQSVSAVSEARLERQQADSFTDYAPLIPGFSVNQSNAGEARLILRGVNTGSVGSTVGVYVDETPFGSSSSLGNAAVLAGDFDTFDMDRVEVVRGPQGTLYGANALGGVLKFVTNAPRTDKFEARGQGGIETVRGGDLGYSANALVNVPLSGSAAIRASGFYRKQGGYIDAVGFDREDVNDSKSFGGRVSLLFEPSEAISVRLTGLTQSIRVDAESSYDVDPVTLKPIEEFDGQTLRGLNQVTFYPDQNDVDYRLANGTVNWDLGFATLTSSTSYGKLEQPTATDQTIPLGATLTSLYSAFAGVMDPLGAVIFTEIDQTKFTQEVRLTSPSSERFEWLVGAYYTNEEVNIFQDLAPFRLSDRDLIDPAIVEEDVFINLSLDSKYKELAGFGNLTYHISPEFQLSAGGRYSENKQRSVQRQFGGLLVLQGQPTPQETRGKSSEGVFTWSFSGLYEPNDNTTLYARIAKGYRPGGPNVVPPGAAEDFPVEFVADTIVSYEGGVRWQTPDRRFGVDVSAYYNDWKDILVFAAFPSDIGPVGANANGGGARTYGVEATAVFRPMRGFNVTLNGAFNDSKLTDDTPEVTGGLAGDELPFSPRWSGSATADYDWDLNATTKAFVGATARYVGKQSAGFDGAYRAEFDQRLRLPSYEALDLRAGLNFQKIAVSAFVKNVFNSHGLTDLTGFGTRPGLGLSASPIRPRTIGLTLGVDY